jgi:hydrophobe/amphiphile efflux-1 (HAE1) family protein
MSWNISAWSIKQPVPTIVLFLLLTVIGWYSFLNLGIDINPNVDVPAVTITVTEPGADPSELETQVTKKIEDAVSGIGNIDTLISRVTDGLSLTTISFIIGTNSDRATNDVRNAVSQIRQNLPQDVNDPIIQRLDIVGGPIVTYVVRSDQRSVEKLSNLIDQTISRNILTVKGVSQVKRFGGIDREIRINLDPNRLQSLGITATQVNDQIRALNINLSGGRAELGGGEQNIRTLGNAPNIEALKINQIILPNGATVPLSSLGTIEDKFGDIRQTARLNNKPVVAFQVLRSSGSVLVTVEAGVREAVRELQKTLPPDIKLDLVFTRADVIRQSYDSTIEELIQASILAVLVILIFLRDWRATLITAITLPLSMIPTFAVEQILGYTLNNMTLLALALAVGNLVDDAVVEIENLERHMAMGKPPLIAAFDSSDEVGLAVMAASATIIAVFLPVAFMGGIPGQFFQPFGVTVAVSTIFSTLVARMLTPMMGAYLLQAKKHPQQQTLTYIDSLHTDFPYHPEITNHKSSNYRFQPYKSLLQWSLRHRLLTMAIALGFFIASLTLLPLIPKGFVDDGDYSLSSADVELAPGSTLEDMNQVVKQATDILLANPIVEKVLASEQIGSTSLIVKLKPRETRSISQKDFEESMRDRLDQIPGARISFENQTPGDSRKDLAIVLRSDNPEALNQAADALEGQIRNVPGIIQVTSSASLLKPEIIITPRPQQAADLGVTVSAIARTASLATIGDTDVNLAKYNLPDRQIPIRVQIDPQARTDINAIKNLQIPSQNGGLVPLVAVADIHLGSGPATINRYDRARQVLIEGNLLKGNALGKALEQVNNLPIMRNLPPGVEQQPYGGAKIMQDIFSRFGIALLLALLSIYSILVLLYNNFLHPLTIMAALPFCLGGVLLALLISQKPLGLYALIGMVLLLGIVTKNSILLVDYTIIHIKEGKTQRQALIEAGISRLRPILMTSFATIAGILPLAMGIGAGSEVRQPMGIAIIGGFTTSTLLTLVIVPVIFSYIDDLQNKILRIFRFGNERIYLTK